MDALTGRAYAAYFRGNGNPQQPADTRSGVERHKGLSYVVLRNVKGILAVYRVRNDGMLRRMKRWPSAIREDA